MGSFIIVDAIKWPHPVQVLYREDFFHTRLQHIIDSPARF